MIGDASLRRFGADVIQKRLRDISEDHEPITVEQVERAEADEAVAGADIENDIARRECGVVQHDIAIPLDLF